MELRLFCLASRRRGGGGGGEEGTCASVSREGGGGGVALNLKPKRVAKSETAGVLPFGEVGSVH
jgi:hypothetical protein